MVAYNFTKQFANLVEDGIKRQTVRKVRAKRPTHAGDTLQLYTGMMHKGCRKLREAKCLAVDSFVAEDGKLFVGDVGLRYSRARAFAIRDGFASLWDFFKFYDAYNSKGRPAVVIRWTIPVIIIERADVWFHVSRLDEEFANDIIIQAIISIHAAEVWRAASGRHYVISDDGNNNAVLNLGLCGIIRGIPAGWERIE